MPAPRPSRRDRPTTGDRFLHSLVLEAGPEALNRGLTWIADMAAALCLDPGLGDHLCQSLSAVMARRMAPANDWVITLDVKNAATVLTVTADGAGASAADRFHFASAA